MAAPSSKFETAISKTSALDGEVAELHADLGALSALLCLQCEGTACFSRDHGCVVVAVKAKIQSPTRDSGGALCGKRCCSGAPGRERETYIPTDEIVELRQERISECIAEQVVHVPVPPNPEETVEVMKLASQGRVQQRTVEQIIDVHVTMRVEAAQAQCTHRVMDVPVRGRDRNGSQRQLHRSQQQQQHQGVHEEKEAEKVKRKEKERRREKKGQGQGGHRKEEAKKQREREEERRG